MKKAKVFVIMPFTDEFFESYEMLKEHFENEFDFHMQVMRITNRIFLQILFLLYMKLMLFWQILRD